MESERTSGGNEREDMHVWRLSVMEKREPEANGKFARCFKEVLKSEVKTLDLDTENQYNMSYKL